MPSPSPILHRTIRGTRDDVAELPAILERVRPDLALSDEQFFNLVIAMTEAVNNAIEHGNEGDEGLGVAYAVSRVDGGVLCQIDDRGEGFELDEVEDPTSPENLLKEGGRGLFLINALMRDVRVVRLEHGARLEFFCPEA